MPTVTCPSCGEKGRIPATLVGARIKCRKCATSFLVAPASPREATPGSPAGAVAEPVAAATPAFTKARGDDLIEVAGLDESAWATTEVVPAEHDQEHHPEHHHDTTHAAFTPHDEEHAAKQYKLLTPKDKYFEGKFDLDRLEQALNHFAQQGWIVKAMSTPHIAGFSGGEREMLVILLER